MGKQRTTEIAVGAFMATGFMAMFFLSLQVSNLSTIIVVPWLGNTGYQLKARFENIGSLKLRAPVNLAGVRVGRVENIELDQSNFEAVVTMRISPTYRQIPEDTFANIFTAGLLGEQYIGLSPGGSSNYLGDGAVIVHTQSAIVLEQLIGQFLFSKAGETNVEKNSTQ